ncbi:MAG: hypothetical protein AAGA58_01555 [Verrucomicrobiota bacterium]
MLKGDSANGAVGAGAGENGLGASFDAISKGLAPAGEASVGAAMDDWFGGVGA